MPLSKSFISVICSVILHWGDAANVSCTVILKNSAGSRVPLYYFNGSISITCTRVGERVWMLLANGTKFIKPMQPSRLQTSSYSATLNEGFKLGDYKVLGPEGILRIISVDYLLCDQTKQVQPIRPCTYKGFCVVNMKDHKPECKATIECGHGSGSKLVACSAKNKKIARDACMAFSHGDTTPIYLFLDSSESCETVPVFKQWHTSIGFGATIPIPGMAKINMTISHKQNGFKLSTKCTGRLLGKRQFTLKTDGDQKSNTASTLGLSSSGSIPLNLPERATVSCNITDSSRGKQAEFFFYILFYDPSHTLLTLSQGDIKLNITEDPVDLSRKFDPKKPIRFTATTNEKLYIAVAVNRKLDLQYQENASHESSITFRYDPKRTTYSFIATVYFYELPPFGTVKVLTIIKRKVKLDFGIPITCGACGRNTGLIAVLIVMTIISVAGVTAAIVLGVMLWKARKKLKNGKEYDMDDQPTHESLGSGSGT